MTINIVETAESKPCETYMKGGYYDYDMSDVVVSVAFKPVRCKRCRKPLAHNRSRDVKETRTGYCQDCLKYWQKGKG